MILIFLLNSCFIYIFILIAVAYFTLVERKILGSVQRRRGPNVIGLYGILQPLVDGLKLLVKEPILPSSSDKFIFIIAPIITFLLSLVGWVVIPFTKSSFLVELDLSVLYILACSSLGIYGILTSGWSSNSKYAFLGALRSAAQMVSYELPLGVIIGIISICTGSFNLNNIIEYQVHAGWFIFVFPGLFLIFFICGVAETNRHPFDLPEAEAELVSGYNVEYSAMAFALFSLGEYSNILMMSAYTSILFLGGWAPLFSCFLIPGFIWFSLKMVLFVIIFVLLRAGLPRYRYDQLMEIGWQNLLPLSLAHLVWTFSMLMIFDSFPF